MPTDWVALRSWFAAINCRKTCLREAEISIRGNRRSGASCAGTTEGGAGNAQRNRRPQCPRKRTAPENSALASRTRRPVSGSTAGCDSGANGIVTVATDDGRRASRRGFSWLGHEHWPASDDVLPGGSIQAASKTSVRFASGAGRAIHARSRMRNRSAASGNSEGLRLFESGR